MQVTCQTGFPALPIMNVIRISSGKRRIFPAPCIWHHPCQFIFPRCLAPGNANK